MKHLLISLVLLAGCGNNTIASFCRHASPCIKKGEYNPELLKMAENQCMAVQKDVVDMLIEKCPHAAKAYWAFMECIVKLDCEQVNSQNPIATPQCALAWQRVQMYADFCDRTN